MADEGTRREELITGALTGDLSAEEQIEFDRVAALDPSMRTDLSELRELSDRLASAGISWREEDVPTLLEPFGTDPQVPVDPRPPVALHPPADPHPPVEPVAPAVPAPAAPDRTPPDQLTDRRRRAAARRGTPSTTGPARRRPWIAGVAAGLVLVGAAGGIGVQALADRAPSGPPGTLGAVEPVAFSTRPAGGDVTGSLVAHTWGTETVLQIDGLAVGETYDVVLLDRAGRAVDSGAFLGSGVTITCRMNAAVLRPDVAALQIRDDAGEVVAAGTVPLVR